MSFKTPVLESLAKLTGKYQPRPQHNSEKFVFL